MKSLTMAALSKVLPAALQVLDLQHFQVSPKELSQLILPPRIREVYLPLICVAVADRSRTSWSIVSSVPCIPPPPLPLSLRSIVIDTFCDDRHPYRPLIRQWLTPHLPPECAIILPA